MSEAPTNQKTVWAAGWTGLAADDDSSELEQLIGQRVRARILQVLIPVLIASVAFSFGIFYPENIPTIAGTRISFASAAAIAASGFAVSALLMWYLQTGFTYEGESAIARRIVAIEHEKETILAEITADDRFSMLNAKIADIEVKVAEIAKETLSVSATDREALAKRLFELANQDAAQTYLDSVQTKFRVELRRQAKGKFADNIYSDSVDRLAAEIASLTRRGNTNLVLGSATTTIGLGLLGYFVLRTEAGNADVMNFAQHFLPRISLIILIQIFAFFFLKLYKSSLEEIKYYQNEITSLRQRQIALFAASESKSDEIVREVISVISKTDRNSLTNAQTLQQAEHDRSLIQTVGEAFKGVAAVLPGKPA